MSWDLNSYAPESEALQAERETWEAIVANETSTVRPLDACDSCGARAELFHNERTGLSFCEACDLASEVQPVRFKRLRSGAWGLSGPASYLREGEQVVVEKRGGTRDTVRVGRVLWADNAQNKAIATIAR